MFNCAACACQVLSTLRRTGCGALARALPACECFAHEARVVEGTLATRRAAEQHFGLGSKFARHSCAANLCTGSRKVCASLLQTHAGFAAAVRFYILLVHGICRCVVCGWTSGPTLPFCVRDSLAEWSKALTPGTSPQGRGFEPHSCHLIAPPGAQRTVSLYNRCCHDVAIAEVRCRGVCVRRCAQWYPLRVLSTPAAGVGLSCKTGRRDSLAEWSKALSLLKRRPSAGRTRLYT